MNASLSDVRTRFFTVCCTVALLGASTVARAALAGRLADGIQLYEDEHDPEASAILHALLAAAPPAPIAAKAHVYLGLIAFNALATPEALAEFSLAIQADAAVELPRDCSPKARIAFTQAQLANGAGPPPDVLIVPSAPASHDRPVQTAFATAARRVWWPSCLSLGIGAAALGAASYFAIAANGDQKAAQSASAGSLSAAQAINEQNQARVYNRIADIGFGTAATAGVTAVILYLALPGQATLTPSAAVVPGGAAMSLSGRW